MENSYPFYTIGHAARGIDEFAELLKAQDITLLADVRTVPRSRANPQYNESALQEALNPYGIGYIRIPELGGFRAKSKEIPQSVNGFWKNNSFHSYADYAMSGGFRDGLNKLLELGKNRSVAIMCAEMLWWRCHRRIIADYLIINGKIVFHIFNINHILRANLTDCARITSYGTISYPFV